jgi:hypothetical protein
VVAFFAYQCKPFQLQHANKFLIRNRNDAGHRVKPLSCRKSKSHFFTNNERPVPVSLAAPLESRLIKDLLESSYPRGFFDKQ